MSIAYEITIDNPDPDIGGTITVWSYADPVCFSNPETSVLPRVRR